VTGSAEALNHVKAFVKSQNIKPACGNFHRVQGKGDVTFRFSIGEVKKIEHVLYVLDLHKNFLFVGSLTDKGLITIFNVSESLLLNKQGVVVARGVREKK
jgi:hypothetical protein